MFFITEESELETYLVFTKPLIKRKNKVKRK